MAKEEQYQDLLDKIDFHRLPQHIAIIMDGNGRWAASRRLPRSAGHKAGVETLRKVTEICREIEIPVLSVYAFSTENWLRPADEVGFLMKLFIQYLRNEVALMNKKNIRLGFLGDKNGLPDAVRKALAESQAATANNDKTLLNIAVNYGGRDEIIRAVRALASDLAAGSIVPDEITDKLLGAHLDTAGEPDPDLIIRPSGEYRLSNFLLWQGAYAELYFTKLLWPDFTKRDLLTAVIDYQSRSRRFGKTPEQIAKD